MYIEQAYYQKHVAKEQANLWNPETYIGMTLYHALDAANAVSYNNLDNFED